MTDRPSAPDTARGPDDDDPDDPDDVGTPRWVKVFGIVAAVLVALFVVLHLAGGGFRSHGP